jgi:hypothetical protein
MECSISVALLLVRAFFVVSLLLEACSRHARHRLQWRRTATSRLQVHSVLSGCWLLAGCGFTEHCCARSSASSGVGCRKARRSSTPLSLDKKKQVPGSSKVRKLQQSKPGQRVHGEVLLSSACWEQERSQQPSSPRVATKHCRTDSTHAEERRNSACADRRSRHQLKRCLARARRSVSRSPSQVMLPAPRA